MAGMVMVSRGGGIGKSPKTAVGGGDGEEENQQQENRQEQLSLVDFLVAALRKSMVACRVDRQEEVMSSIQEKMEIGWPTNVQHITHVTFDRFQGFLGLPLEFQVEIPSKVPSASVSVFGVSAETMQCCYDKRGNSVPTILLLMQERLYAQTGLEAEGIFRINPENSKEEHVREQLNRGIVPDDIEVHCLAGLIKAWFRELPSGILDGLSPDEVLQCKTEEEFVELVKQLKPTESALLNWAIDLMSDVVEHEQSNKMNARNIAMVFAPNMTQMSDPLTALMHAVQVMNLLKSLIVKTLREREEIGYGNYSPMSSREETEEEEEEEEMMDTSCESEGVVSDEDQDEDGDEDEVESLSEIEEHFLRQLDENENAKNDFRKKLEGIILGASPGNGSTTGSNMNMSDGEESREECSGSRVGDDMAESAKMVQL